MRFFSLFLVGQKMKSETSLCACRCKFAIGTIINNNPCYSAENTSHVYPWYVENISLPHRGWAIKPKLYNCREFWASEKTGKEEPLTSAQNTFSLIIILHINEIVAFWLLMKFTNFASFESAHIQFFSSTPRFGCASSLDSLHTYTYVSRLWLIQRTKVIIYNHVGSLFNAHSECAMVSARESMVLQLNELWSSKKTWKIKEEMR